MKISDRTYMKFPMLGSIMMIIGLITPLTLSNIFIWDLFYIEESMSFLVSPLGMIIALLTLITTGIIVATIVARKFEKNKLKSTVYETVLFISSSFLNLFILFLLIVADYSYVSKFHIEIMLYFLENLWGYHYPSIGFFFLYFGASIMKLGILASPTLESRKFLFKPIPYFIFTILSLLLFYFTITTGFLAIIGWVIIIDLIAFLVRS